MHEFSLMESVIRIVKEASESNRLARITSITLVVGKLSGVNIEALRFAFEALKNEESLIQEAVLEIEEKEGQGKCSVCDKIVPVWHYDLLCPDCGMPMQVAGGDEFYVKSITGERDG
ncbi:MAG: hydrogenase maturation nickel metallochaperone HypA [Caldiserica bacterium]|jgi:hydrogenase nickel incorporation protein HypA/HybF|nr:hydrogenase maturation nickel metallochaperone HypA [Caldisericota bacterium]